MQKQMALTEIVAEIKDATKATGEELVLAVIDSPLNRWDLEDIEYAVALVEGGRGW